jgi:hypothetical protein
MARRARYIVNGYAQVWPRAVFDIRTAGKLPRDVRQALGDPGVYVLYREDQPYYVGKTSGPLFNRIWNHANQPADRYYNFWNFFSVFAVVGRKHRDEVEGILIAAMPTNNSASPRFRRIPLPARVGTLLKRRREIVEDLLAARRRSGKSSGHDRHGVWDGDERMT